MAGSERGVATGLGEDGQASELGKEAEGSDEHRLSRGCGLRVAGRLG
jgi:hypothetical protein